jgi:hypothetical protein
MGPLFYFTVKVWSAKSKRIPYVEFALKWIMFFGILSVVIISLNMKYNAKNKLEKYHLILASGSPRRQQF